VERQEEHESIYPFFILLGNHLLDSRHLKYLLFTTPQGGFFPTMMDQKSQGYNRFRNELDIFLKSVGDDKLKAAVDAVKQYFEGPRQQAEEESGVQRPGVYQWHEAFNKDGDISEIRHVLNLAPDDLLNYDIIHINLCGSDVNAELVTKVKEAVKGTSIKVIANMDYAIENIQSGYNNPSALYKALLSADFVFAQEPAQQALLNYFLHHVISPARDKVSVPIVRHPIDIDGLRKAFVPLEERLEKIVVCWHRYDRHTYIPSAVTWNLEAYHPTIKVKKVPIYIAGISGVDVGVYLDLFDGAICYKNWPFYLYELSHATIGYEYYSLHSHSRFPEECAVLGIPVVGNTNSYSITQLHPFTCHNPLDFVGMRHSLIRLLEGDYPNEFTMKCVDYAWEKVQEQGHKASKMRLMFEMNKWEQVEGRK